MPTSLSKYLDPTGLDETVVNIRQIAEGLEEAMQNLPYARPDGIYPDMTVGAVIGADSTAQWSQRVTEGSGSATVRSVQGAAVAWNQLVGSDTSSVTVPSGHKYLGIIGGASAIATSDGTAVSVTGGTDQLFDLTTMFGSGNEPTTVAEFERMYPEAYYPYSTPTLKPVQIAGIESTNAQGGELDSVEWETQTLRAAGSVADVLTADELVRRVGVVTLTGNESMTAYSYSTYRGFFVSSALPENGDRKAYSSSDFGSSEQGTMAPNTNQFAWLGVNNKLIYLLWADCPYATSADAKAWLAQRYAAGNPVTFFYELNDPTTTPISPTLAMSYKVEQGGSESIIVPDGEMSAPPVLTVAEPVNAGDEFARIWAAIQSLGYTRNAAQLSRPVSLTDIGSIDEVQDNTTEIETIKEVKE